MRERVTISLPSEVAAQVREMTEQGRTESVSAFISEAVAEKVNRQRRAREWLDRKLQDAEHTDPEGFSTARTWAERVFPGTGGHAAA